MIKKMLPVMAVAAAVLAALPGYVLAGNEAYCVPARLPVAKTDNALDKLFSQQYGPGWVGGDSTYSARLPDGREVFVFSDTFIGTAQPDGKAAITGMPRNTELVGRLPALKANYNGTYSKPGALIPDYNVSKWFWVSTTYSENNTQLIYVNEYDSRNVFGQFTGKGGIATMELPPDAMPRYSTLTPFPEDPHTIWGQAEVQDAGYHLIYGLALDPVTGKNAGMKLARVPQGYSTVLSKWEYWNGRGWAKEAAQAVVIQTGDAFNGVMKQPDWMGRGYIAVSIPNGVFEDTTLGVSFACAPQGPWSKPEAVYTLPEITGPASYKNEMAYIPTVHPELDGARDIVVSYNINTTNGLAAYGQNIHIYQPRFVRLSY